MLGKYHDDGIDLWVGWLFFYLNRIAMKEGSLLLLTFIGMQIILFLLLKMTNGQLFILNLIFWIENSTRNADLIFRLLTISGVLWKTQNQYEKLARLIRISLS